MLSFRNIEKTDVERLQRYYNADDAIGCECNMVSAYLWSREYSLQIAEYDDTLIKAYLTDSGAVWGYCMPAGKNVRGAVEAVLVHAAETGERAAFDYMSRAERDALDALFPQRFTFENRYDTCDYIYLSEELATLPGKRFHAKRNHVSKFYRSFPDSRTEPITDSNCDDALRVVRDWCAENGIDCRSHGEYAVIEEALACRRAFAMRGMLLYVGDKPIAMTLGSATSKACFDVNFEKALRGYDGSYAVINRAFAQTLTAYRYINREEDLGLEGLRKSKLSYHPVMVYERFGAVLR